MKFKEALEIMSGNGNKPKGYMVHFEKYGYGVLKSDYFPDKHAGEELIKDIDAAWEFARAFAVNTDNSFVNIYLIDENFYPVSGYSQKMLKKYIKK